MNHALDFNMKHLAQILIAGCAATLCATLAPAADKEPSAPTKAPAATAPATPTATTPVVVTSDGKPVIALQLPKGAVVKTADGRTDISAPDALLFFQLWHASKAKSLDDAVGMVSGMLEKWDVKGFKLTATKSVTIAGAPAKQLTGTGTEADDGDPSQAVVIVFTVGDRTFVACTHGERNEPAEQQAMLAALQTAKQP